MAKPLGTSFAQVYGSVAEELTRRLGDSQAAQMGPPLAEDIEPAGDRERVKAWNARNPEATDDAMRALAQQQLEAHLQSGMDVEKAVRATAEDLTHFRYGQRLSLYTFGQIGSKDQVKEAERIASLAKRESTPDPQPPPPAQPSAGLTNLQMAGAAPDGSPMSPLSPLSPTGAPPGVPPGAPPAPPIDPMTTPPSGMPPAAPIS